MNCGKQKQTGFEPVRFALCCDLCGEGLVAFALIVQPREKSRNGNILVERIPVQAAAGEPDLLALLRSAFEQAREPRKRNAQRAAVAQLDPKTVFIEAHTRRTS